MNARMFSFVVLMSTVLLSSCAGAPATTYSKSDRGKTITVNVGDTFMITLEGNPTTGYAWEALPDSAGILSMVGDPDYDSSSKLVGSGGMYTFTFKADAVGETTLELIYHRSFEQGVDPIETFQLTVDVK